MDSPAGQAIRDRLSEARKKAGLRQEDVAKVLGVARQTVSKWEAGKGAPNPRELGQLCALYDVNPDWIISGVATVPIEAQALIDTLLNKPGFVDSGR